MIPGRRVRLWENEDFESTITYGHWHDDKQGEFVDPPYTSYSDYSGSLVERSNLEEFIEEFADSEDAEWVRTSGGHGTQGLLVRVDADERVPEIGEFFEGLENYPLANAERHSELEMEVANEAWDSYGRSDFRRWLREYVPEGVGEDEVNSGEWDEAIDALTDDQLSNLWWEAVSNGDGEEVRHEDAVNTYFDYAAAFRNTNLEQLVRETLDSELAWGRLFAEYLGFKFLRDGHEMDSKRVEALPGGTKQAMFDYFYDRTSRILTGGPGMAINILHSGSVFGHMVNLTKDWNQAEWSILLDTLEEEGPAAFEPGHAGRRFGRR